jgi:hypothetical protein
LGINAVAESFYLAEDGPLFLSFLGLRVAKLEFPDDFAGNLEEAALLVFAREGGSGVRVPCGVVEMGLHGVVGGELVL